MNSVLDVKSDAFIPPGHCVEHMATPGMQVCLRSGVMLLRACDDQEVKLSIAGAQLHFGHLLLRRVARRELPFSIPANRVHQVKHRRMQVAMQ